MNTRIKIKKIVAAVMSLLMLFSAIPFSAYASAGNTLSNSSSLEFGVISGSYATYGHELHYAKSAGTSYILWCGQYGKTSPNGSTYTEGASGQYGYSVSENSAKIDSTVAAYVYFGYILQFGDTVSSLNSSNTFAGLTAKQCACACQQYVWQAIGGKYPSKSSWNSSYMNTTIYNTWYNATKALYKEYHNAAVSFDGTKLTLEAGESTTLTDSNGYLQYYPTFEKTIKTKLIFFSKSS